jgi:NAD-dependent dihydropyrimidine dehydrogenase PreA subunit
MTYVITEPCIGTKDASCVDVCPVDCIHSTGDDPQYYINPETCLDCAACESVCPVSAIFFEDDGLHGDHRQLVQDARDGGPVARPHGAH